MRNETRQTNTTKPAVTASNNLYNSFNNGIFEYKVSINNYKYYFIAYISIENNNTVRLIPYISNTSYVPNNIVYSTNTIYYKMQIKSLQFGYPGYASTCLLVTNFNSGSYSYLMCAKAESSPHNWWLGYKSINASENSQDTEVSAYGNACFYGIFAGSYSCTWLAYPEINIHAYSSGTTVTYIHNTIYNSPKLYSSSTLFNGDFSGYKCVMQYIVS